MTSLIGQQECLGDGKGQASFGTLTSESAKVLFAGKAGNSSMMESCYRYVHTPPGAYTLYQQQILFFLYESSSFIVFFMVDSV